MLASGFRLDVETRENRARQIILKLATILAPLHQLNPAIVHRDLKPSNILVHLRDNKTADMKIADFGLGGLSAQQAILTSQQGNTRGYLLSQSLRGSHTPLYASPEQERGGAPDPRDDVHALGVMWYQLLVGDLTRRASADLDDDLRDLKISEDVIGIIKRCVARAERRWDHAGVLAEKIRQLTTPVVAPVQEPVEKTPKPPSASVVVWPTIDCAGFRQKSQNNNGALFTHPQGAYKLGVQRRLQPRRPTPRHGEL
jgi:serine/threonine protein kinase